MKKRIGVILIILGFLISVASPYLVILVGSPIFLVGVSLVWLSKTKLNIKILWTVIPIIMWVPSLMLFFYIYSSLGKANAQKRDYYINSNLRGNFIVAESNCGLKPLIMNDRLQFEIPNSGVYMFNGELRSGHIDERVFLRNPDGTLTQLTNTLSPQKSEEIDTLDNEKIISTTLGSFGTRYSENEKKSNYITHQVITNKKMYTKVNRMTINRNRENHLDSLINNCEN